VLPELTILNSSSDSHIEVSAPTLATFAICAYNQEKFIADAVAGAFSQTYSPLQIILSDDCSPDSTFEIMRKMAAEYIGPHKILLNRNKKNLGLSGHVNQLFELAQGTIFIGAAGDDISLPERVAAIVSAFDEHTNVFGISSNFIRIDQTGKPLEIEPNYTDSSLQIETEPVLRACSLVSFKGGMMHGCSAAYRKCVHTSFGPLPPRADYEDMCLTFRCLLLGDIGYINKPLLLYRSHTGSITHSVNNHMSFVDDVKSENKDLYIRASIYPLFEQDLKNACNRLAANNIAHMLEIIDGALIDITRKICWLEQSHSDQRKTILTNLQPDQRLSDVIWRLKRLLLVDDSVISRIAVRVITPIYYIYSRLSRSIRWRLAMNK
jgi:glycosyltransferase involved in cell wall biosynthesis